MTLGPTCTIYQVWYDEETRQRLDPRFVPYFNDRPTKYLPDGVIIDLYRAGKLDVADYCGVVSWKFGQRIEYIGSDDFSEIVCGGHDFYYASSVPNNPWAQGEAAHGVDLTSWTERILAEIGLGEISLKGSLVLPAYRSYQVVRRDLYRDYVRECLIPFVERCEDQSRADLQSWLNEDANYIENDQPVGKLMKLFGRPYWTKHPFITERLFPTYASIRAWRGEPFGVIVG